MSVLIRLSHKVEKSTINTIVLHKVVEEVVQCRGHLGLADSEEAEDAVSGCGTLGLLHWNVAPGLRDELMKPCSG